MEQEIFFSKLDKFIKDFVEKNNKPYIIVGKRFGKRNSRVSNYGRISIVADFEIFSYGEWFVKIEKRSDIDYSYFKKCLDDIFLA